MSTSRTGVTGEYAGSEPVNVPVTSTTTCVATLEKTHRRPSPKALNTALATVSPGPKFTDDTTGRVPPQGHTVR